VNFVTSMPVSIMVLSQRDEVFEPFTKNVLQSDYVTTWSGKIAPYASNILDKNYFSLPTAIMAIASEGFLGVKKSFPELQKNVRETALRD